MTRRRLALSSLRHHWRSHAGVLAGAVIAAAVLVGALAVGDSVRGSLADRVRERLGHRIATALSLNDRFVTAALSERINASNPAISVLGRSLPFASNPATAGILTLPGTMTRQDGTARANRVQVLEVSREFERILSLGGGGASILETGADEVWLGEPLARQLKATPGDAVVLRIHKPSALSRDAVITPRDDQSVALRFRVGRILPASEGGDFGLQANQVAPLNAFVPPGTLAKAADLDGRVNLLVGRQLIHWVRSTSSERLVQRWSALREHGFQAWKWPMTETTRAMPPEAQTARMDELLSEHWQLADAELAIRVRKPVADQPGFVELTSRRIFLDPPAVSTALAPNISEGPVPVLTYLVNSLESGDRLTPYSMVTAAGPPYTPADLADDEIVVSEWLAGDLGLEIGDSLRLTYYRADSGPRLVEHTNLFRVRSIVPMTGVHADRTLMPEFPGLAKAESTRDWDAGFDLLHTIRDKDEAYWKEWRGTPKAFVNPETGRRLWANRFGNLTAIRWPVDGNANPEEVAAGIGARLQGALSPRDFGVIWQPVEAQGLRAAASGQDFGGLFLGFSFFLILSALLLTSMLFQFALERRAGEVGLLLAVGWTPSGVRRLLLREGLMLAALGTALGVVAGVGYARAILAGLNTLWRDAVAGGGLNFHLTPASLVIGALLGFGTAAVTLTLALRGQASLPARQLLEDSASDLAEADKGTSPSVRPALPIVAALAALGLSAWGFLGSERHQPAAFFGAGAAALAAGALGFRYRLRMLRPSGHAVRTLFSLALRGISRRPSRSLATVLLLASASFLLVVVAASRLDARRDAAERSAGTGGFAFWGETSLPVVADLDSRKGRESFGLDEDLMEAVAFVPFRVRDGDDASCLNLNRTQQPRLLGVDPERLSSRRAFTFTASLPATNGATGWDLLSAPWEDAPGGIPVLPAIGDANSIQWALGRKVGDTMDYLDDRGRPFRVRIVGAVANSVLQGSLIIPESGFVERFPTESGHRVFLVDAPADRTSEIAADLSRAFSDVGLELTPAAVRLDRFNAVQNTYLNTFQMLGGLGLLLGSVGLGVVVLRNVQERRGELALMKAVGFDDPPLRRMVLSEHAILLGLGIVLGVAAAVLAILPSVLRPGTEIPWSSLALTFLLVVANGLFWTWLATRQALRGDLLSGLREL